jgi:hypothetical protein
VIAAVVMVVAMSMTRGSGVIVGMAHGIGGIREMPSLYDICAYVNVCN